MNKYSLNMETYQACARQAAAEGCVLLKNKNETLPLRKGDRVALFGRMASHYYKSGLGSGGLVNAPYVVGIADALKKEEDIHMLDSLSQIYEEWEQSHPYDDGEGWGKVPWSQEEMPLDESLVLDAAKEADAALIIIARTAGEDQDNAAEPGQYLLTDKEKDMIRKVCYAFKRAAVLLNVGNIIDMKWVEELDVPAVLYVWQGGQEGGNGVCDVLTGRVSPCGKLTDTIARDIADYPSTSCFGGEKKNYYQEDIYVGYRYFETFAKEKALYPFGYGLSYTKFDLSTTAFDLNENADEKSLSLQVSVKNTGAFSGKEVVQIYVEAPCQMLGKPSRVLADYGKTKTLAPGEEEILSFTIPAYRFASFDDSGVTGHKNAYVLEEGTYNAYVGNDVRSAKKAGDFELDLTVIEQLQEAFAPGENFQRMCRKADGSLGWEETPIRTISPRDRVEYPAEIPFTGDQGYTLGDVYYGKISMETFIAQLTAEDLASLFRGEGMCSPKVTPGTGSAFGGLTEGLRKFGIPAGCTTDGPSGLRLDVGTKAFSLPNGTALGCTFNDDLAEELFGYTGLELRRNRVDALLGPGINIHRNPLNGRNFEYISEDPLLTGRMAAAMIKGMNRSGSTGTIKHFAANSQEKYRRTAEGLISQRALREIYLKGFEIAVKEGKARSVMTTYGPVNGLWTAGNYDLNTLILRKEWGFEGIVMSDWWADANHEGCEAKPGIHAPMAAAGNDLFMVCSDAGDQSQDDLMEALQNGSLTIGQLQRNAANILGFLLKSPAMLYELDEISPEELKEREEAQKEISGGGDIVYYELDENGCIVISGEEWDTKKDSSVTFGIIVDSFGAYDLEITASSQLGELAQLPVSVFYDSILKKTVFFRGTEGRTETQAIDFGEMFGQNHYIRLYFGATGLKIHQVVIRMRRKKEMPV